MNDNSVQYFKSSVLSIIEVADKQLTGLIREWINIIYKNNKGYSIIWPELAQSLNMLLIKKNYNLSNEIYELLATITQRYTEELQSDRLITEILDCMCICDIMFNDMISISQNLSSLLSSNELPLYMNIMKNCLTICYNFNYQDFPEYFEDHLDNWIKILLSCCSIALNCNNEIVVTTNIQCLKIINLYYNSYLSDITNYKQQFLAPLWSFLPSIEKIDNESLVIEVIEFYKIILLHNIEKLNENNINIILEKLVFPYLKLSNKDIDEYENDQVAFMRQEIEEVEDFSCKFLYILIFHYDHISKSKCCKFTKAD